MSDHALRVSEARYLRRPETAQDAILLLNADTGQIEDVNRFLTKMLAFRRAELMGRKLWEIGTCADRAERMEMFAELQATGYVRYHHLTLKTKYGRGSALNLLVLSTIVGN